MLPFFRHLLLEIDIEMRLLFGGVSCSRRFYVCVLEVRFYLVLFQTPVFIGPVWTLTISVLYSIVFFYDTPLSPKSRQPHLPEPLASFPQEANQTDRMLARQAARLIRAPVQARKVSGLVDKPSHVTADQKLFTSSHKHTYIKRDSDKLIYGGLLAATAFGFLQFFRGELNMARGTGKKD